MINIYDREVGKKGRKRIPVEMTMIDIMREFGWSYDEYINTPQRVIDLILAKSEIDYKNSKNGNK